MNKFRRICVTGVGTFFLSDHAPNPIFKPLITLS
jgi:hypothetical protein